MIENVNYSTDSCKNCPRYAKCVEWVSKLVNGGHENEQTTEKETKEETHS